MASNTRFGKKLRIPSTIQIKHQLLVFWLKRQSAKEAAEVAGEKTNKASAPLHIHEAF